MKTLIVASVLVGIAGCAQVNRPKSVELLSFGIFGKVSPQSNLPDSGTVSESRPAAAQAVLLESTTNIPAQIGTSFGVRVRYHGRTPGAVVNCTAKCVHPKLTDPSSGRTSEVEEWDASSVSGAEEYIGYTLDKAWELVPGEWKLQVWVGSKLMVEKAFILQAPSGGPASPR